VDAAAAYAAAVVRQVQRQLQERFFNRRPLYLHELRGEDRPPCAHIFDAMMQVALETTLAEADIGVFRTHGDSASPFNHLLRLETPSAPPHTVDAIVRGLGAESSAGFLSLPHANLLSARECWALRDHLDRAHTAQQGGDAVDDLKLPVSPAQLHEILTDEAAAARVVRAFGGAVPSAILLRRCAAYGQCIDFHLDHCARTMQVALNDDTEYAGGRLVFAVRGQLVAPRRPRGSVTLHGDKVAHGVSTMVSGVRYGLFVRA
jgi:hypothetical protein